MLGLHPPVTQVSVQEPTAFIVANWHRLMPDWVLPVRSVLIILQHCQHRLVPRSKATEIEKYWLRQRFLHLAIPIADRLHQQGYLAEPFDPTTGLPHQSQPGLVRLDDVAVVAACLGYAAQSCQGCSVLIHPLWGDAVYPAILLSSAPPEILAQVVSVTWPEGGSVVKA